ncbi:MAG: hypothetical protein IPL33_03510 [Sphingobacteriales bacterium]|nr:hypothetical protein [Sphingobacteriales bacterium]
MPNFGSYRYKKSADKQLFAHHLTVFLPAADLPEGMYLLQLQNGQRTANTCKVTIIR